MFTLNQRVQIQDRSMPAKYGKVGTIERLVDEDGEDSQIWVKLDIPIEGESRPNFRDFYRTRNPESDLVAIASESGCVNHGAAAESDLDESANTPDPVAKAGSDRFGFSVGDTVVCARPGQAWSHNAPLAARLGQPYRCAGWGEPIEGEFYTVLSITVGDDKEGVVLEENAYAISHKATGKVSIVCNRAIEAIPVEKVAEPTPAVEPVATTEAGILQFNRTVKHCDVVMFGDQKCIAIDIDGEATATLMFDGRAVRLFAIK